MSWRKCDAVSSRWECFAPSLLYHVLPSSSVTSVFVQSSLKGFVALLWWQSGKVFLKFERWVKDKWFSTITKETVIVLFSEVDLSLNTAAGLTQGQRENTQRLIGRKSSFTLNLISAGSWIQSWVSSFKEYLQYDPCAWFQIFANQRNNCKNSWIPVWFHLNHPGG